MKFEAYSRRQTQILFELIASHVAETAKTELDTLRSGVEARINALQASLSQPEHTHLLEQLVQELTNAARGEADAARNEAEAVAAKALLKAREDAESALAAEQRSAAALRSAVEEARQQLRAAQAAAQAEQAVAQATAQAAAQSAAQAAHAAQAAAQAELDRTRLELEGRLEQVQLAREELARVLAETRRDASAAQAQVAAQATSLKDAQARVQALEQESTGLLLARDEAIARATAEGRRVQELSEALAASRQEAGLAKQEARLAKADAEGRRQALEASTEQLRLLEDALTTPGAAVPVIPQAQAVSGDSGLLLLDHVGTALESIDVAISASEILETLIEQLGRHFARAAVFLVGPSSFKGWRGSGLGSAADIGNIEIPRTIDSLLTRTLADRKLSTVAGNAGDPAVGVLGSPVATALALPVFANGRVIALAYAEHAEEASASSLAVGCKIAEILIDHANRRLTVKRRGGAASSPDGQAEVDRLGAGSHLDIRPSSYSPSRQVRRAAMKKEVEITLEGTSSVLVDLSPLGAQVLSPVAMRPKRVVRLTLPAENGDLVLKGRVVWAQFEQATGRTDARYRAGVKFTEADERAVDAFIGSHGIGDPGERTLTAKLEETA